MSNTLGRTWIAALAVIALVGPAAQAQPAPRESLLVLEKQDHTLAIIDLAKPSAVTHIVVGEDPHELAVTADGKRAYITNYGGPGSTLHMLSAVDLEAQKPLPPIDLGLLRSAHGIDIADGKVYFTAETAKAIGRYDPATNKVDWTIGLGLERTHMIKIAPGQTRIYTANVASGSVAIIDRVLRPGRPQDPPYVEWAVTEIKTGAGAEGFDISPDGKSLWVANGKDGTVSIIDTTTKTIVQTLTLPWKFGSRVKFTPDGKRVLVSSDQLVVIDAESKAMRTLKLGDSPGAGIVITPDGRTAYVAISAEARVAIVDLTALKLKDWIKTGISPDGMALVTR